MHNWQEEALGSGWSWNDYDEYYMAERSVFLFMEMWLSFMEQEINELRLFQTS